MREIKFRAWCKGAKHHHDEDKMYYQENQYLSSFLRRFYSKFETQHPSYLPFQVEERLMQYTGLKDKNGKEIYEGDVIKYEDGEDMNHWIAGEQAVVLALPGRFTARMTPYDSFSGSNQNMLGDDFGESVEIIGNIHENPELINKDV